MSREAGSRSDLLLHFQADVPGAEGEYTGYAEQKDPEQEVVPPATLPGQSLRFASRQSHQGLGHMFQSPERSQRLRRLTCLLPDAMVQQRLHGKDCVNHKEPNCVARTAPRTGRAEISPEMDLS